MEDNLNLDALTSQFTKGKKRINSRRKGAAFERKLNEMEKRLTNLLC